MALAFLAFFGFVAVAALRYADTAEKQHAQNKASALAHSAVEGAGLFALVDGARQDMAACAEGAGGDLTFASGDTLSYQVAHGGCGKSCTLCILGATAPSFCADFALTVPGEVDMNGSARFPCPPGKLGTAGSLCARFASGCDGRIVDHGGNVQDPGFKSVTVDAGTVLDPLSGRYPLPLLTTPVQHIPDGDSPAQPGVYTETLTGSLCPGLYVVTRDITSSIKVLPAGSPRCPPGDGVTIFLGCSGDPDGSSAGWHYCAKGGEAGAGLEYGGSTPVSIAAPIVGTYANLAIYADPNNTDSWTFPGSGLFTVTGNVYAPRATVYGGPSGPVIDGGGRLVVGALRLNGSADEFTMKGLAPTGSICNVYSDTLSARPAPIARQGHIVMQTACNGGRQIASFDYAP